jgi:hypothetical protein
MNMRAYAKPLELSKKEVKKISGKDIYCPNCSESTKNKEDIGWINCPIMVKSSGWICRGCCIDICITVNKDKPNESPLFDEIEKIALSQDFSKEEVINICLKHQLSILNDEINIDERSLNLKKIIEKKLKIT